MRKKGKVFIGLSGGVDSSVGAAILKKDGYDVVGVFIRTWHPEFLSCNEEDERRDAMRVAAHLNIPFLTFDFEEEYKREVGDYMIREYKAGRTPNPDVMCNKEVKFGSFLRKAISMGADYVATGHYAINDRNKNIYCLKKGKDPSKDQSYFLWTLNQDKLSKILFPVGHLKKIETRKLAKKIKLPVAEKKDSQGICFLGEVDLKFFLKHFLKEKKGKVVDENGRIIGWHDGAQFYTLGERHGFTITTKSPFDKRYFVIKKDMKKNVIVVSQQKKFSDHVFPLRDVNWIGKAPKNNTTYEVQVRYHGELLMAKIDKNVVIFNQPIQIAPGQSCVIYEGSVCLGGGVVI